MKYTTKAAEKSTVKITIKFDGEEWKKAQNDAYLKTRHKYRVDGFRNGKAPKNRIESFYGKTVFWDDALNLLIQENYDKILEKESKKYVFVGEPEFQLEDLKDDLVVIVATVPVKPELKISAYTGMKIEKFAYTVSDADVQAEIDRLLDKKATREEVTDRAAENGDIVTIDFVGTVDGVKFDGGEAEGYDLVLGSGSFIPGFEDQVVGMNLGEQKDVNVTFPEDYQAAELKGKAAVFAVTLHKIQKKVLPEFTDEFVKETAGEETIAAWKEKTTARLQENLDRRANDATENSIIEAIAANTEVEIPQAMIEREIDGLVKRFEYQLMYQGLKLSDYLSFLKVSEADFRQNYAAQAEKNVKSQLIISHIIEAEKIEATEEELEAKIAAQAASVDKDPAEYKATMDPRQIDYLRNDIIITKLFDFLKANNEMFVAA